jgi:hypothetical protein
MECRRSLGRACLGRSHRSLDFGGQDRGFLATLIGFIRALQVSEALCGTTFGCEMNRTGALCIALLISQPAGGDPRLLQRYAADVPESSSSLTLYTDDTFLYESCDGSCWTWQDTRGTWSKERDIVRLTYELTIDESQERLAKESVFQDASRIMVKVIDPNGAPVRDVLITFNGHGLEVPTGPDGLAFLNYEDIPEYVGSGWCRSKKLNVLIIKRGKRQTDFPVGTPESNYFEAVLDETPGSREETRQDVYRIVKRKLYLVSDGVPERAEALGDSKPGVLVMTDAKNEQAT